MAPAPRDSNALVQRAINRPLSDRIDSATADVERIIEATYAVIAESETLDPTMREILKAAGLSTQRFYRYFASKDELLLAILDDGRRVLGEYLQRRFADQETGEEKIRTWIDGMYAQAADPAAASRTRPFITNRYRLMEQHPDEMQASIHEVQEPLHRAIEQAAVERGIDPPGADAMAAAYHLTVARMEEHIVLGTRPTPTEVEATADFTLRALGLSAV